MANDPLARLEQLAKVALAAEGKADTKDVAEGLMTVIRAVFEHVKPLFQRADTLERKLEALARQQGPKGDKGDRGDRGPQGLNGIGKEGPAGRDGSPDTPVQVREKLETLRGKERLHIDAIEGVEEKLNKIELRPSRNIFGVPSRGFFVFVNGDKKGLISSLNIIGGTGIAVSYNRSSGRNDITLSATGSASLTPITVTGTIDDSNTVFTAASAPNLAIVNGQAYRDGHGVSISGTTVTLDAPVGTGGDIYCL